MGKVKVASLSRLLPSTYFGYRTVSIDRPFRDEKEQVIVATKGKRKGKPGVDSKLRDMENIPLDQDVFESFDREVRSHVQDAWIDEIKRDEKGGEIGIVGYEIPFKSIFYVY